MARIVTFDYLGAGTREAAHRSATSVLTLWISAELGAEPIGKYVLADRGPNTAGGHECDRPILYNLPPSSKSLQAARGWSSVSSPLVS